MKTLAVTASIEIDQPAELVRRQFADVAHHARSDVHRGVRFTVIDDDGARCRYRQATRVGPIWLRQELVVERVGDGPLVNEITRGQFEGGKITFDVSSLGPGRTRVDASVEARLTGLNAVIGGLLQANVQRSLTRALEEDKIDLEGGGYAFGT